MNTIAVAVVMRHRHVLVGRRAADARDAAGLDEFPGGKVEAGEAAEVAAARECLEEAGLAVRIDGLLDRTEAVASSGPLVIHFYAATPVNEQDEPLVPFAWVPIDELPTLQFPAANARVLERIVQGGS